MTKTWLILREPRRVPERKGPFTPEALAATLREFMDARPSAFITVLTCEGNPEVQDGPECLEMIDARSKKTAATHRATSHAAFLANQ